MVRVGASVHTCFSVEVGRRRSPDHANEFRTTFIRQARYLPDLCVREGLGEWPINPKELGVVTFSEVHLFEKPNRIFDCHDQQRSILAVCGPHQQLLHFPNDLGPGPPFSGIRAVFESTPQHDNLCADNVVRTQHAESAATAYTGEGICVENREIGVFACGRTVEERPSELIILVRLSVEAIPAFTRMQQFDEIREELFVLAVR